MSDPDPGAALEDIVFLALQRPAMMLGVPAEGLMINLVGSIITGAWIGVGSWRELLYMGILIPVVHLIMKIGAARDHNWFSTIGLWVETDGFNTVTWGGSTVTPIPD